MAAADNLDSDEGITGINITPLVDIFLVLLILVMITSSLLDHRQIDVSVPKAAAAGSEAPKASGLVMDLERNIYLDGQAMDSLSVLRRLSEAVAADSSHQVLISADASLIYQDVINLLDMVKVAGISQYALKVVRQP